MNPNPLRSLNHFTVPLLLTTASFVILEFVTPSVRKKNCEAEQLRSLMDVHSLFYPVGTTHGFVSWRFIEWLFPNTVLRACQHFLLHNRETEYTRQKMTAIEHDSVRSHFPARCPEGGDSLYKSAKFLYKNSV